MNFPEQPQPVGIDTSLIECIVVAVPDASSVASVTAALDGLAESEAIRILDLVAVTRSLSTGEVSILDVDDLGGLDDRGDARVKAEIGGLLSENDIALASAALLPGSAGVLVVVEDRWAGTLSSAAQRAGGRVIGGGRIPRTRIEAVLAEPPSPSSTAGSAVPEQRDFLHP